jgi:hypothetical protein
MGKIRAHVTTGHIESQYASQLGNFRVWRDVVGHYPDPG